MLLRDVICKGSSELVKDFGSEYLRNGGCLNLFDGCSDGLDSMRDHSEVFPILIVHAGSGEQRDTVLDSVLNARVDSGVETGDVGLDVASEIHHTFELPL